MSRHAPEPGGSPTGQALPASAEAAPPAAGVIGTAGHVDHGKTTLVRALTGIDTDRLPEEKRRGISIDLGFAHLALPSGRQAGVVDVPGHERFIRNMVAGASGIDLVLLVVAADEGVMPQTREHLDIALLLGVTRGVVALTKADLAEPDWCELVAEEVGELLRGTPLAGAPQVPVSAVTGQGLPELLQALDRGLQDVRPRQDRGFVRLAVDRVFTVAGFGTVVTGTLTSGAVALEDRLELLPQGLAVRVRGLQVHGRPVERARAGQRVAINLGGVERSGVRRGDVLATPGSLEAQTLLAVRLRALPGRERGLRHGQRLHLHLGTAETVCRLTLLETDELAPGAEGFGLLRLERPLAAGRGDRFILRSYSPVTTVGGGVVLEAGRRFRRHSPADLQALVLAEKGDPAELLLEALAGPVPQPLAVAARQAGLPPAEATALAEALAAQGKVVALGGAAEAAVYIAAPALEALRHRVREVLAAYHRAHPLRPGMTREELRRAALEGAEARVVAAVLARLEAEGLVHIRGERVALRDFAPSLPPALQPVAERLVAALEAAGLQPPPVAEALQSAGFAGGEEERSELLAYLVEAGRLVRVDPALYFGAQALAAAVERVRAHLRAHGTMTVAELRDLLGVTRKHAVPLAEYLDAARVTRREGDVRRLVQAG
jgi:selenocysteine-specific elongation factor